MIRLRELWWDWNPKRLRRLLKQAKGAIDANANGWSNTHQELLQVKEELVLAHEALHRQMPNHHGDIESSPKICGNCSAVIRWRGGWPIADQAEIDTTRRSQQ
jgi:hypothetical protein